MFKPDWTKPDIYKALIGTDEELDPALLELREKYLASLEEKKTKND